MTDHNYAGCQESLCQRCDDYSAGYVDGKSKALFEVSTQTADQAAGCGCGPCQAVVKRLRRRRELGPQNNSDIGGLGAELALLLGIELADGEVL